MLQKIIDVEVKSVGERKVKGTGIRFTNADEPDSYREWFSSKSEVGLRNGDTRPMMMEHGWNPQFGKSIVAWATYEKSETGWDYEATFEDTVMGNKAYGEISTQRYRSSAGAAGHTVQRTETKGSYHLDTWLVSEQTFTKRPADSQNPAVSLIKGEGMEILMPIFSELQMANSMMFEAMQKSVVDVITNGIADKMSGILNEKAEALRGVLTQLRESFKEGQKFEITEEFLNELEVIVQPITLINL